MGSDWDAPYETSLSPGPRVFSLTLLTPSLAPSLTAAQPGKCGCGGGGGQRGPQTSPGPQTPMSRLGLSRLGLSRTPVRFVPKEL